MSNGSEHTPERCVHAVDGPDWAGLREPTSWKERAIAAEAENVRLKAKLEMPCGSCHPCTQWANQTWINAGLPLPHVIDWQELKAERDALLAVNVKHRADLHEWETVGAPAWVAAKDSQLAEVWAERDALQARLDAMTVEWGVDYNTMVLRAANEETARHHAAALRLPDRVRTRLVGPWTVVPEGDGGKLTSRGLEKRPDADFDVATHRPLGPEGDANA